MKKEKNDFKNIRRILFLMICAMLLFLADPAYAEEGDTESGGAAQQEQEGQVNGLTAEKQTVRSIQLKWEITEGVQGYTVYQYHAKSKSWKELKSLQQNFFVVRKLKPASVYKFRVAAYRGGGSAKVYLPASDVLITATVPQKTSLNVTQAGFYLANYHLRLLICRAKKVKGASGYQYAYSRFRNRKYKTMRTKKLFHRMRLQKGRVYYFKVRAYKKVGDTYYYGEYSDPKAVRIK